MFKINNTAKNKWCIRRRASSITPIFDPKEIFEMLHGWVRMKNRPSRISGSGARWYKCETSTITSAATTTTLPKTKHLWNSRIKRALQSISRDCTVNNTQ